MVPETVDASTEAVRTQLARILASSGFGRSSHLRNLLSFLVARVLEGKAAELKEYTIAVEAFRRPASFDPRLNPIVRVQASNLRNKLKEYYAGPGSQDPLVIELPRGSYIPQFIPRPERLKPSPRIPRWQHLTSLAVLPCVDLSPSRDQEYFCDGITEEIISALSSLEGVRVVGRTSVSGFKGVGPDIRSIGAQLGVQDVLETSLRREQNQMRVTARLAEVATGFALWSKSFDFATKEVFAVQEEIAQSVAESLQPGFSRDGGTLIKWRSKNADTYNLFLLARFHLNRRRAKDVRRSISILERLLEKDPANPRVLSCLAECHLMLGMTGTVPASSAMTEAENFARKALAIDDRLADAHATLGSVKALYDWDWKGADLEFRRALELCPSHAWARTSYVFCYLLPMGRAQDAIELLREAVSLDPLSLAVNYMLSHAQYASRQYDEVIRQCQSTIDLDPTFARSHALMAVALAFAGSHREAVRQADEAVKLTDREYFIPNWATAVAAFALAGEQRRAKALLHTMTLRSRRGITSRYWTALANASLGKPARALALLKGALRMREPWLAALVYEPLADPLRTDKRFRSVIGSLGLAERRRQAGKPS